MRGKRLVNAIPTAALLAIRRCSASRTSGRRSSRVEGRPTGSDSGNLTSSGRMERCITCGYSPAKKAMSFSLTEILRSNSGTNVAVRAYSTFACRYEVSEVRPPSKRSLARRTPSSRAFRVWRTIFSSLSRATSSKYA